MSKQPQIEPTDLLQVSTKIILLALLNTNQLDKGEIKERKLVASDIAKRAPQQRNNQVVNNRNQHANFHSHQPRSSSFMAHNTKTPKSHPQAGDAQHTSSKSFK